MLCVLQRSFLLALTLEARRLLVFLLDSLREWFEVVLLVECLAQEGEVFEHGLEDELAVVAQRLLEFLPEFLLLLIELDLVEVELQEIRRDGRLLGLDLHPRMAQDFGDSVLAPQPK